MMLLPVMSVITSGVVCGQPHSLSYPLLSNTSQVLTHMLDIKDSLPMTLVRLPHADEPGVIIAFEPDKIEQARRYTDDFPLSKMGFLEWIFIALMARLPIEGMFRPEMYDRTAA
jgi:hypothetical protein